MQTADNNRETKKGCVQQLEAAGVHIPAHEKLWGRDAPSGGILGAAN